jgi:ATP-dependent Clp protease ATP-binding subunit ClpA
LAHLRRGDPFDSAETVAAAARAMQLSLTYRHPDTGTSHLLLALIEDDAGEAPALLNDLGIDLAAVREHVEQDLQAAPAAWPSAAGE